MADTIGFGDYDFNSFATRTSDAPPPVDKGYGVTAPPQPKAVVAAADPYPEIFPLQPAKPMAAVQPLDPMTTAPEATQKFFVDTKVLDECFAYAENMRDMLHSDDMALKIVGVLSFGLRRAGELLSDAIYRHKLAKSARRQAEAIAALDNFGSFLAERKMNGSEIKATDSVRQHYVALDDGAMQAAEREAFYEAQVSQLETYKTQFTMVMSAIKAMIAKQRSDALISGLDGQGAGDRSDP